MTLYRNILECIGKTPLVELTKLRPRDGARVFVKIESMNPSGSVKARSALSIVEDAERSGLLKPGGTIVEASSGNQGIALAMIGAVKGYRVIVCLPENMSVERRKVLRAYGAEIVITPVGRDIKETIELCIDRVKEILASERGAFWAQQFDNPSNVAAHYSSTAGEILSDLGPDIDAFVAGIGTGGTISGVGRRLKESSSRVKVVAVEPESASLLTGGRLGHHVQEGIGDGVMPAILDKGVIDRVETVSDEEALAIAKRMATEEGIFCGISTGATVCGAIRVARDLPRAGKVVAIMADGGEKYLSTVLCK